MSPGSDESRGERRDLRADCANCFGLCCVALPFTVSADFPINKEAGQPCRNLLADSRCAIHPRLRQEGFSGCAVFECFGAGQQVSRNTFGGRDWRHNPESAADMFRVFPIMRQLQELLWYVTEALEQPRARAVHEQLCRERELLEQHTAGAARQLLELDVGEVRTRVKELLVRTSELVRAEVPGRAKDRPRADLLGARLRKARLRGASLCGAWLIAADLPDADLRDTDLIGTDLRDTDLRGADLSGSLFLTQPQVNAAKEDRRTVLPAGVARDEHW